MTLYEINESIKAVLDAMSLEQDENGEIDDSYIFELDRLQEQRDEKLEAIGCYIKNLDAEAEAIKTEINALKARMDAKIRKSERIEEYVKNNLLENGDTKKEFPRVCFSFRKSTLVSITDVDAIPSEYKEECVEWKPVKKEIGLALKMGKAVPGAELVTKQNLQIK